MTGVPGSTGSRTAGMGSKAKKKGRDKPLEEQVMEMMAEKIRFAEIAGRCLKSPGKTEGEQDNSWDNVVKIREGIR